MQNCEAYTNRMLLSMVLEKISSKEKLLIKSFLLLPWQLGEGVDGEGEGDNSLQHQCSSIVFRFLLNNFLLIIYYR